MVENPHNKALFFFFRGGGVAFGGAVPLNSTVIATGTYLWLMVWIYPATQDAIVSTRMLLHFWARGIPDLNLHFSMLLGWGDGPPIKLLFFNRG